MRNIAISIGSLAAVSFKFERDAWERVWRLRLFGMRSIGKMPVRSLDW
jgi:hypothetical protein